MPRSSPSRRSRSGCFGDTLGDGILTSEGASWRWQRRTAAPLFRPADLASLVPAMTAAAEDQVARWRSAPAGTIRAIDRDMTETTFHVISATMFAGSADAGGRRHPGGRRRRARHHLLGHRRGHAAPAELVVGAGQAAPAPGWPPPARRRRRHPRAAARRGLDGADLLARLASAQRPGDRCADVGGAADRQSRDLPRRRPRDHRQGADLDALSARPRAAVAGAHLRRGARGRHRGSRSRPSTSITCPSRVPC